MPLFAILILIFAALLPIGWIIAELTDKKTMRIFCGIGSFVLALLIGVVVGLLQKLQYNADYGFASKQLFEQTVESLRIGNTEQVITEYERLCEAYSPTYENKADFDELVKETAERLNQNSTTTNPEKDNANSQMTQ